MNKNNKIAIGVLVIMVALAVYLYYNGSLSYFTQSNYWPDNGLQMVMVDSSGDLVFQSATKLDEAINTTVNGLKTEMTPMINAKLATSTAAGTYLSKTDARGLYAPKLEYVQYDKSFRLTTPNQKNKRKDLGGYYARKYKGGVGWNPWWDIKDDTGAKWEINKLP